MTLWCDRNPLNRVLVIWKKKQVKVLLRSILVTYCIRMDKVKNKIKFRFKWSVTWLWEPKKQKKKDTFQLLVTSYRLIFGTPFWSLCAYLETAGQFFVHIIWTTYLALLFQDQNFWNRSALRFQYKEFTKVYFFEISDSLSLFLRCQQILTGHITLKQIKNIAKYNSSPKCVICPVRMCWHLRNNDNESLISNK